MNTSDNNRPVAVFSQHILPVAVASERYRDTNGGFTLREGAARSLYGLLLYLSDTVNCKGPSQDSPDRRLLRQAFPAMIRVAPELRDLASYGLRERGNLEILTTTDNTQSSRMLVHDRINSALRGITSDRNDNVAEQPAGRE